MDRTQSDVSDKRESEMESSGEKDKKKTKAYLEREISSQIVRGGVHLEISGNNFTG